MRRPRRVTVFAGHYGSGKTLLALNYALSLRGAGLPAVLADLDIVNPYFRAADFSGLCESHDIRLIASPYANSNVDIPALPAHMPSVFDDESCYAVLDVGGDDRGAVALGRYARRVRAADCEILLVVNVFRPLSRDPEAVIALKNEMEAASGLPFTGIVNNANLGPETAAEDVQTGAALCGELSRRVGLPLRFTAARRDLAVQLPGEVFPVDIYSKPQWKVS